MAAANFDQESVLLPSDEGSHSAAPPAGRLPIKAALAVGLCVVAAGLAGAAVMVSQRPAAAAPTKIRHPWAVTGLNEYQHKHMSQIKHLWAVTGLMGQFKSKHLSQECKDKIDALEKEAEEEGRTGHHVDHKREPDKMLDCKESEQACTVNLTINYGGEVNMCDSRCFPTICKKENMAKELEDVAKKSYVVTADVFCYECCFFDLFGISFGCYPEKKWFSPWCPARTV